MNFGIYSGQEFLRIAPIERKWIVEGLIKRKDSVLFVGGEKSGKSICAFQIMASVTSQHPFLDTYPVPEAVNVCYVQLEGELEDSRVRFERMKRAVDVNFNNIIIKYSEPINLEAPETANDMIDRIKEKMGKRKLDILMIDPLYFAMSGSISDDVAVRKCLGQMRRVKNALNCALFVVHHTHKIKTTASGKKIDEGDEATFGSKFIKAYFDHTILLTYDKKTGIRTLRCETQRSGTILKEVKLKLVAPDPLFFERIDKDELGGKESHILSIIPSCESDCGITYEEIHSKVQLSRTVIYQILTELVKKHKIEKSGNRPVSYKRTYTNDLGGIMTLNDVTEEEAEFEW